MRLDVIMRSIAAGLIIAIVGLGIAFGLRALTVGFDHATLPFSLSPSEFSNLATIKVIRAGMNPYAPEVYANAPFVVSPYTPIYHYLVAMLPMPDANPFLAGRLVAAAAMMLAATLPLFVAGRKSWPIGVVAGVLFLSFAPVTQRAVIIRVDALGLLFTGVTVISAFWALRRKQWAIAAAASAIVAVFAKQSFFAAPFACALFLFLADRRTFRIYIGAGFVLSVAVIVFVQFVWGSGFWFSTIEAVQHPMLLPQWLAVVRLVVRQPLFVGIIAIATVLTIRELRHRGASCFRRSPYLLYVIFAFGFALATVGKIGSGTNYFVEPVMALLMWSSFVLRDVAKPYHSSRWILSLMAIIVLAGAIELASTKPPTSIWATPKFALLRSRQVDRVRESVTSLGIDDPSVLGLIRPTSTGHVKLYRESDRVALSYPLFYYWLWRDGLLDVAVMRNHIEAKDFDIVIVSKRQMPNRYFPFISSLVGTVTTNYQSVLVDDEYRYYVRNSGIRPADRQVLPES